MNTDASLRKSKKLRSRGRILGESRALMLGPHESYHEPLMVALLSHFSELEAVGSGNPSCYSFLMVTDDRSGPS